jgi:hypothetical protein
VQAVQPDLTSLEASMGILKRHLTGTNRLHFRTLEFDAGLEGFEDLELMASLPIPRHALST